MITQERLQKLFYFKDGSLFRRIRRGKKFPKGSKAGHKNKFGYISIRVDGKTYQAHRLIYLYVYGFSPENIDHRDGDRSNNRIENIRSCSVSQNRHNQGLTSRNTSGKKGVQKFQSGWRGTISKNGFSYRKLFKRFEDAAEWVDNKRKELHGEFACYGRRVAKSLPKST